jgi:hypothetical protein
MPRGLRPSPAPAARHACAAKGPAGWAGDAMARAQARRRAPARSGARGSRRRPGHRQDEHGSDAGHRQTQDAAKHDTLDHGPGLCRPAPLRHGTRSFSRSLHRPVLGGGRRTHPYRTGNMKKCFPAESRKPWCGTRPGWCGMVFGMAWRCRPLPQQMVHVSPDMMVSRDTSAAPAAVLRSFRRFCRTRARPLSPRSVPGCATRSRGKSTAQPCAARAAFAGARRYKARRCPSAPTCAFSSR